MKENNICIDTSEMGSFEKKYLFVDKCTGEVTWKDVSTETELSNGLIRYIREDVVAERVSNLENKLALTQNEVDRLSMRIYTRC